MMVHFIACPDESVEAVSLLWTSDRVIDTADDVTLWRIVGTSQAGSEVGASPSDADPPEGFTIDVPFVDRDLPSGGHFAFIPGGGLFPAALGDLLAGVGNRYAGIQFAAPAAAQMERMLVQGMAELLGYPTSAAGDLTSGASVANLEGIITARDAIEMRAADVPRSVGNLTSHTHHCIKKALRIAGLGECVVRHLEVDHAERMRPEALEVTVGTDVATGLHPWLVVATAGTTDTGAVDPLTAIADIAETNTCGSKSTRLTVASSS